MTADFFFIRKKYNKENKHCKIKKVIIILQQIN